MRAYFTFATLCFTDQATSEKIKEPLSLKTFFSQTKHTAAAAEHSGKTNIQVSTLSASVE